MGLNIGSASILLLFAVLSLTVLAALSLLSANSQMRLARRSADVVTSYYAADTLATEIYGDVIAGDLSRVKVVDADGITNYNYTIRIDDSQSLDVSLTGADGAVTVSRWKIIESGEWTPDDDILVWDGE
jgi:bacillopeptidase F (M6 metalloprotease family)